MKWCFIQFKMQTQIASQFITRRACIALVTFLGLNIFGWLQEGIWYYQCRWWEGMGWRWWRKNITWLLQYTRRFKSFCSWLVSIHSVPGSWIYGCFFLPKPMAVHERYLIFNSIERIKRMLSLIYVKKKE